MARKIVACFCLFALTLAGQRAPASSPFGESADAAESLLFYLSGERGFDADFARGDAKPNFQKDVAIIPGGAHGAAFQCEDTQVLAYRAPGNIYAQRGTLSFFWRARYPVGPTAFPVFRVGYADHSSWDMTWLRIDYNGHGFDAFVTDINLARTRVSCRVDPIPSPQTWTHLALAWDENYGIRFYINGKLAAEKKGVALFDAALDQFGPHARIVSPYQVQSAYNFIRGGDVDEIRIDDRMIDDAAIAALARGEAPAPVTALRRDLSESRWRGEWLRGLEWQNAEPLPPPLPAPFASVRKVEIHDAWDLKRWWWKANDGVRETTWPGVYNRSRLPGRLDYFVLPDWDCYALSGKAITFDMPQEPWNHIEMTGAAHGAFTDENGAQLFTVPKGGEKFAGHLSGARKGGKLTFTNTEQETPIGEFSAYYVSTDAEPKDAPKQIFILGADDSDGGAACAQQKSFITGRYPADARAIVFANEVDASTSAALASSLSATADRKTANPPMLPIVHILIPYRDTPEQGLDGVAIELPAMPDWIGNGAPISFNLRIKDPLWPLRDMLDFDFALAPGNPQTLWLDTRDRMLPPGKCMYFTLASAAPAFSAEALRGGQVRLVFKPAAEARPEHELDRFTQVRDLYAMWCEEGQTDKRLDLVARMHEDLADLLRVNPDHRLGQEYRYALTRENKPEVEIPAPPAGVPAWAFYQVEYLRRVQKIVDFYIDERQIENGELGGGLSDDDDLTNLWPPVAMMGVEPNKIARSLRAMTEACYANGMFERGLPAIQSDELHSYEEGIEALSQCMLLDEGDPLWIERAMETARALPSITGINAAGHRHIKSSYFSGSVIATEDPWQMARPSSYLILHPAFLLARWNGNPQTRLFLRELAEGLLPHWKDGELENIIHFPDDKGVRGKASVGNRTRKLERWESGSLSGSSVERIWPLFLSVARAAEDCDGDAAAAKKYALMLAGVATTHRDFNPELLAKEYRAGIERWMLREYINTQGSVWIDRVSRDCDDLQQDRLGGIALVRQATYPRNAARWRFKNEADALNVAICFIDSARDRVSFIAHNLSDHPVEAEMLPGEMTQGLWNYSQWPVDAAGQIQENKARRATKQGSRLSYSDELRVRRGEGMKLHFPPGMTTRVDLRMEGSFENAAQLPDWGFAARDIARDGNSIRVTLHSLGAIDAPATTVALIDADGKILAEAAVASLAAPLDLMPRTQDVVLAPARVFDAASCRIVINPQRKFEEVTRGNNAAALSDAAPVPSNDLTNKPAS